MIPLHDDNPTLRFPILTVAIILACFGVLLFQTSKPDDASLGGQVAFMCEYGVVPANTLDEPPTGTTAPGEVTCYDVARENGRFISLVTHQFLHAGWIHLIGNMLFLWVFGNNIEDRMGRIRFIPFYLLCGIIAALAQAFTESTSDIPMIGASGAVSAMLGAYVVLYPRAGIWTLVAMVFPAKVPAWAWVGIYFVLQFVYLGQQMTGGASDTAYAAHVGGFVAGMALIKPFLAGRPKRPPRRELAGPTPRAFT